MQFSHSKNALKFRCIAKYKLQQEVVEHTREGANFPLTIPSGVIVGGVFSSE